MKLLYKYNWLLPSLVFTSLLLIGRHVYTGSFMFFFLLWNLFLAAIPLYISRLTLLKRNHKIAWLYVAIWLLFFPNSMYIVTDLFHLRMRKDIPQWYDLLLLFSAAVNGLIMGFLSLFNIEIFLKRRLRPVYVNACIFLLLALCGYGIYLGRYLRWNSWDIITQPFSLLRDIFYHVRHPFGNAEVWVLTAVSAVWMYICYSYLKKIRLR